MLEDLEEEPNSAPKKGMLDMDRKGSGLSAAEEANGDAGFTRVKLSV
jgi:hypothetical protein